MWRQQRRDGQLGTAKRGPPKALVPVKSSPANSEAQQLRRENRRLKRDLETALLAIEIQKKVTLLMELHRATTSPCRTDCRYSTWSASPSVLR